MSDHDYERKPLSLATGDAHRVKLPPRVMRGRLTGFLFDTNKTFLLPAALRGIRGLADFYAAHPGLKVLVTGHTDTVGPDGANLGLSNERARAVAAFLVDDVDAWMKHYRGTPASSVWATREDQHMLTALPHGATPYYAGPVHGVLDAATQDAVKRFQTDHGLKVDGFPGDQTRRALVTDYMAIDGTSLPAGTELATHGCGEYHNAVPTPDETAEQQNRRVEVFFFEGPIAPPPQGKCPKPGCPEYPEWLRRTILTIDFTLPPPVLSNPRWEAVAPPDTKELRLTLFDRARRICAQRPVTILVGDEAWFAVTDGSGLAVVEIPAAATAAIARYQPDGVGHVVELPMKLALPGVDTDEGAKARLANLGYPIGDLHYATTWFQRDFQIPTTAELDPVTRAKLSAVHDGGA